MTDRTDEIGREKLHSGSRALAEALAMRSAPHLDGEPERRARAALHDLRSALDWLEDGPHQDEAHRVLDNGGRLVRAAFGCRVTFDPHEGYVQDCPVALAHNRAGLSAEIVEQSAECSICRQDPEDCDHITGRAYGDGICCRIITKADILDVSLVARPNFKDARIQRMSMRFSELKEDLGEEFRYGDPLYCDRCLAECGGLVELNLRAH